MAKLKPVKPQILIKLLLKLGYHSESNPRGSHLTFIKDEDPNTVIQVVIGHGKIPVGTISRFIRKVGISREEFLKEAK